MKKFSAIYILLLTLVLSACAGVPLSTMAKMATFKGEQLIDVEPAQFYVALNVDARIQPSTTRTPKFQISIKPKDEKGFDPVEMEIPFQLVAVDPAKMGLDPAQPGKKWLLYGFGSEGIKELKAVQDKFRAIRADKNRPKGGHLALGVSQDWVGEMYPQYKNTYLESWLRLNPKDGFFKLWSGRVDSLKS